MKKTLTISLFLLFHFGLLSQSVTLKSFTILTDDKKVYLDWVLASGSTCNGMKVFRSTDTINFVEVGDIAGICGSSSDPVPYDFTDESPLINQILYYKIRLGYSQFSETKAIFLNNNSGKAVVVKPNPAKGLVEIEFDNAASTLFNFKLFNQNGTLVYSLENVKESLIRFDVSSFAAGQYIFILADNQNRKYSGNIIVSK